MNEELMPLLLGVALLLVAVIGAFIVYRRRKASGSLQQVLNEIGFDRIDGLVLPNADEGEIQIDHLLLTSRGFLILHIKDVQGVVFGSDKMQDWTVMAEDRRYTFANPQPALYDRIAAVRHVIKDVPVSGRLLFTDGAEFTKGVPDMVTTLEQLAIDFSDTDRSAAQRKVDAFKSYWEKLKTRVG